MIRNSCSSGIRCILALACGIAAISAPAATVAHYTFSSPSPLADSSGNGLNLTNTGSVSIVAGLATFSGSNYLSHADHELFNFGSRLTAELYFTTAASLTSSTILGVFSGTANNRAFEMQTRANGDFRVLLEGPTAGNSDLATLDFSLGLSPNTSYFLALVFNGTLNNNPGSERVRLFYKDLTNGGSLTALTATPTLTALNNPSDGLGIGGRANGQNLSTVTFDEVRLSNLALSSGSLLVNNVPEPSRVLLLGLAGLCVLNRRYRVR